MRYILLLLVIAPTLAFSNTIQVKSLQGRLAMLEMASNGRIGISATNTGNNTQLQYRAYERFATGCTSKVIGVAAILKKSMEDKSLLQQKITYTKNDLTNWNPITEKNMANGMTVAELSAAAISYSDNTAMNLLLQKLGGPQAMTAFARSINNKSFRQDHGWPEEALAGAPGDLNDSSTPADMENSLKQLAFGDVLAPAQREQLLTWLKDNTTGNARIRAGVPKGWAVGDKTGTGFYYGITNDIGIIWPPKCAPIVVAIYFKQNKKDAAKREDVIASATRILLDEFSHTDKCLKMA